MIRVPKIRLLSLLFWIIGCVIALESYYIGQIIWLKNCPISYSAYMSREADRLNRKIVSLPVDTTQISEVMIVATVAGEDINFAIHHGINWTSTKRAFMNNVVYKKKSGGGSTITQQVVKNLFLSHKRSYIRKVQEIFLALVTEKIWGKKKILETYLNIAEFGEGLFGVEAAAKYYFNKNARNLTREESVWLVSILPKPTFFQKNQRAVSSKRIQEIKRHIWILENNSSIKRLNLLMSSDYMEV